VKNYYLECVGRIFVISQKTWTGKVLYLGKITKNRRFQASMGHSRPWRAFDD
jgi:hypothetical protein